MKLLTLSTLATSLLSILGANASAAVNTSSVPCSVVANATGIRTVQTDKLGDSEDGSLPVFKGLVLTCALGSRYLFLGADAQNVARLLSGQQNVMLELVSTGTGDEGRSSTQAKDVSSSLGRVAVNGFDISTQDGFTVIIGN